MSEFIKKGVYVEFVGTVTTRRRTPTPVPVSYLRTPPGRTTAPSLIIAIIAEACMP